MVGKEFTDGLHRRGDGNFRRTAENTCRDQRERDGFAFVFHGKPKGIFIAIGQLLALPFLPVLPNRAHGMDNVFRRELEPGGDECRSRGDVPNFLPLGN